MAWVLVSTTLVLMMVPGVGFFYSGLARRKSALSLILLSMLSIAVVSVQVSRELFQLKLILSPFHLSILITDIY
jgi:ammonia channel protein AmtB